MCILASDIKGAPHWSSQCDTNASFLSLSLYSADSLFPHPASSQLHLPPPILQYMRLSFFSTLALPLYVSSYFLLLPFGLTSQLLCVVFSLSTWPTFSPLSFFPSPSPSSLSSCLRENTQFFLKTGVWFWAHSRNIIFGIKSSSRLVSQCLPPHPPKRMQQDRQDVRACLQAKNKKDKE